MEYSIEYLQHALQRDKINPPDQTQANGTYEVLYSVYEAHKLNGASGARVAWNMIKRVRPELASLEVNGKAQLVHADDLKNLSSPLYLLEDYAIYENGFNVLAGASGGGKSFVALDIAGKIASMKNHSVVYIAGEGLSGYASRWESWKAYNKAESANLYFYTEAVQVMNSNDLASFINLIAKHDPALVVIDTLARSAVGLEENSARDMGLFVGSLDTMRSHLNCGVLVVHHTGKDGKIRGSSALYAAADSVLSLTSNDGVITLRNDPDGGGKNKHAPAVKSKYLRITPYIAGQFNGAVLVESSQVEQTEDDDLTPNQQAIIEVINGQPLSSSDIADSTELSVSTVWRNLNKLCKLELVTKLRDGRFIAGTVEDESDVML